MSSFGNMYINQPFGFKSLVSVSSSTSMPGGVRGIYANATASCTLVDPNGNTNNFALPTGTILWINAAYCSQLGVATTNDLVQLY